jgi:hypothetical protein
LALPAAAQQKDTPDPQLRKQFLDFVKKCDEAYNNNDAAALAALYAENGIEVLRETLARNCAGNFKIKSKLGLKAVGETSKFRRKTYLQMFALGRARTCNPMIRSGRFTTWAR